MQPGYQVVKGMVFLIFCLEANYHGFRGRLSYSWPMTAESSNKENLFELGYGLSYDDQKNISSLPIESGLENKAIISSGEFFSKGKSIDPWSMWLVSGDLETNCKLSNFNWWFNN